MTVNVGAAQARARRQHQDRAVAVAARMLGLGHAAHVAVVTHGQRDGASCAVGNGAGVGSVDVEARERIGQIGRMVEHAITLKWTRHRQPNPVDPVPGQVVLGQVGVNRFDPAAHHRFRSTLRVGGGLQ